MSTNWIRQERLLRDLFDTNMYSGYVPMVPEAEGISQLDLQDATAFNNWVDLVINNRLGQVWNRLQQVENHVNETGVRVPGYIQNYLNSLCNPYFQRDFQYPSVAGYVYDSVFDANGAAYDWASVFPTAADVVFFQMHGAKRLEEGDYYTLVYKNGRPLPTDAFDLHSQGIGYSLFVPIEEVDDDDVISIEMRRHWNIPKWHRLTVGAGWNEIDPFMLTEIDKIGYPYCYDESADDLGDFLVYVRHSGETYFKRLSRSFYTAREDGAVAKQLVLTFSTGHGIAFGDEVFIVPNSAGWIIDVETTSGGQTDFDLISEGYERDPTGDPDVFTGRDTTDFNDLDPSGSQAMIDKMPLPVESESEIAVTIHVPGASPAGYRLVPGWDFNLIENTGSSGSPVQLRLINGTLPIGSKVRIIKQEPSNWFMTETKVTTTPTDGIITLLRHENFPVGVTYTDVVMNNQYVDKGKLENISDGAFRITNFPSNEYLYVKYTVPKNGITKEMNLNSDYYRSDLEKYLYLIGFYVDPTTIPGIFSINDLHADDFTVKATGAFTPTDLYEHNVGNDLYDETRNYGNPESQIFRIKASGENLDEGNYDSSEVVAERFVVGL